MVQPHDEAVGEVELELLGELLDHAVKPGCEIVTVGHGVTVLPGHVPGLDGLGQLQVRSQGGLHLHEHFTSLEYLRDPPR